ncbi:MAG TPA: hypothetical protein VGB53_03830 [Rubricoccaceae bacterium]|jgi:hypothetical protein
MKTTTLALLGAFALVAAPALSGCTSETTTDEDTATVVEDDSVDGLVDLDDSLDADVDSMNLDESADSVGASLGRAGEAVGAAAADAGAAVGRAADRAEDAVDANVDLGADAENQGD